MVAMVGTELGEGWMESVGHYGHPTERACDISAYSL